MDYAQRVANDLGAEDTEAQGMRGVKIVQNADGYKRIIRALSWQNSAAKGHLEPDPKVYAPPGISVRPEDSPTEDELAAITAALKEVILPTHQPRAVLAMGLHADPALPKELREAPPESLFIFKDA
jgi:hypothetical protein